MGKKPSTTSTFYRENNLVQRVDRKHWNKAIDLIENAPRKPSSQNLCCRVGHASRVNPRIFCSPSTSSFLLIEIRQAMLRHDWSAVSRLYSCLLDSFRSHRVLCNKILMVFLLSSPSSDLHILEDFCRMILGIDGIDINVFLKTICKLPAEIPRGFLANIRDKLFVKSDSGRSLATSYLEVSNREKSKAKKKRQSNNI